MVLTDFIFIDQETFGMFRESRLRADTLDCGYRVGARGVHADELLIVFAIRELVDMPEKKD